MVVAPMVLVTVAADLTMTDLAVAETSVDHAAVVLTAVVPMSEALATVAHTAVARIAAVL